MTHDDAVAAIASVVEEYNEIVLRVAKATQFTTETIDEETLKYAYVCSCVFIFRLFFPSVLFLSKYVWVSAGILSPLSHPL